MAFPLLKATFNQSRETSNKQQNDFLPVLYIPTTLAPVRTHSVEFKVIPWSPSINWAMLSGIAPSRGGFLGSLGDLDRGAPASRL